ncbi:LysR family transcriptional regulator [soil metagenome]
MDQLGHVRTFLMVADLRSFAKAAQRLGLARSTVTTQVQGLEEELGVSLINRTSRRISLTAEGERFHRRARELLRDLSQLEDEIRSRSGKVEGDIRIEMSESIANALIIPRLPEFMTQYPDVDLHIMLSERAVDLESDGIDVALMLSSLDAIEYRYRDYGRCNLVMAASPAYVARHGLPRHPNDLAKHRLIDFFDAQSGRAYDWTLNKGRETIRLAAPERLVVNNTRAGLTCALAGLGIYEDLDFLVDRALAEGRLVRVLPDWHRAGPHIVTIYRNFQTVPAQVQAFLDFLDKVLAEKR